MMDVNKLKAIGEHQEPPTETTARGVIIPKTRVRIRKVRERKPIDVTGTNKTPEVRLKVIQDPINKNKNVDTPIVEEEQPIKIHQENGNKAKV